MKSSCEVLGTEVLITAAGESDLGKEAIEKAFKECQRIEKLYSRFIDNNFLAELNSKVDQWTHVDPELWELIKFGSEMKEKTNGAFDLTVKTILDEWGYDADYSFTQGKTGKIGPIELGDNCMVKIGSEIDLGALGKGYAVDMVSQGLSNFENFFINAGGDIFAKGRDSFGKPWKIFFEDPVDIKRVIGFTEIDGFAAACTSPSKRRWKDKHHLVDPRTRRPADKILAVYTQAKTCLLADAYATALFVLGYDDARDRLKNFPVEAMLIAKDGEIYRTKGFKSELFLI